MNKKMMILSLLVVFLAGCATGSDRYILTEDGCRDLNTGYFTKKIYCE